MEQKYKLIDTLVREDYFLFGDFSLKNGRRSPYIAKFPDKSGVSDLAFRLLAKVSLPLFTYYESFHLIGLANSGTKLTHAIYEEISLSKPFVSLEIINPKHQNTLAWKEPYQKPIIVVDNAITTGKTLIDFKLKLLADVGVNISSVVRVFDRMEIDNLHGNIDDYLLNEHAISVTSILNVFDLIWYLSVTKDHYNLSKVTGYVSEYCKKTK